MSDPRRVPAGVERERRRMPWVVLVAVAAGVLAAWLFTARSRDDRAPSLASLAESAPRDARSVEGRLSGFRWAPFQAATRDASAQSTQFANVLGATEDLLRADQTPAARHIAGVAQLFAGRHRPALTSLTAAAESTDDARAWSDLAAALHETALRFDAPELLAEALAAADRALARDARLPEALFNRALVIERLGLRDDAREAWERYLVIESDAAWGNEARQHMAWLQPDQPFVQTIERDLERLARDPAAVRALARSQTQDARQRSEMELLGRWGAAELRGDRKEAETLLNVVRGLGREVSSLNGDEMLAGAVAAIDTADRGLRSALAQAHVDYESGLRAFQDNRPGDAEPLLLRAASRFAAGRSPMAFNARYFAANTAFEQGRQEEARSRLEQLLENLPAELKACRAGVLWELGVCDAAKAEWGAAMARLGESAAAFERLGETRNSAAVRRIVAYIYNYTGDLENGWREQMAALRGIGRQSDLVLEKGVLTIASDALLRRKWHSAVSFLNLGSEIARRLGDDVQHADALLLRAAVRLRLGDRRGAESDSSEAAALIAAMKDQAYRRILHAYGTTVRAMLSPSAAEAEALLTGAIEHASSKGERGDLPRLLLQRARARRKQADTAGAAQDLERALTELERNRQSLPEGEARWGAFHADEELFEEAIDLALQRGDPVQALRVAERSRARALLDSYGESPAPDVRGLPPGTMVVEYAALPEKLVILTAGAAGVHADSVALPRATLVAEAEQYVAALRSDDAAAIRKTSATLHRRLIEPMASRLLGAETIVFVADGTTATIPFAALADAAGTHLLDRHAVIVAPSAALYVANAKRSRRAAPQSVLVVGNPRGGSEAPLAHVQSETDDIARRYRKPATLQGDQAGFEAFVRQAATADVIHFAGHAIGDDDGLEPASIVMSEEGRERRVRVSEIARLRLPRDPIVVLAGCNTARGIRRGTEGVISVAHGFLTAGAPTVVATLWAIDDRLAAAFFPRLHARLAEGASPAEALRAVQLEAIHRGDFPPSLWAAVQVIGN